MKSPRPKKRFGQNFLIDQNVINEIISGLNICDDDTFLEIGPGKGAITKHIIPLCKEIILLEIDFDLVNLLKRDLCEQHKITFINDDALKYDPRNNLKDTKFRLVGNLPYNISTPLLFYFSSYISQIVDVHLMLQKEVVDRLIAKPGSKSYGRLSVMIQYQYKIYRMLDVSAEAFNPIPKVNSSFIRLVPHVKRDESVIDKLLFLNIVKLCFSKRRKIIKNSLKKYIEQGLQLENTVDLNLRPENISVSDFVALSNAISSFRQNPDR
tara:strand:+ start:113 stop:913 length:801 start_codon:yes stop_codon:yes gene_type:complete